MVRSALALGGLRRDTDRELSHHVAIGVRDKLGEIEATLATAARKTDGTPAMPGKEIERLSREYARLDGLWKACTSAQGELRTAEELCLEALARDIDAVDLIDGAIAQRQKFRRDLFWLLGALRPQRPGATLLVHSPDARAAVTAWVKMALHAAELHGWRGAMHVWGEQAAGWTHNWGPPHDRASAEKRLAGHAEACVLVRIAGTGSDLLFGLEQGLHKFQGLAGEPCHAWIDLLEPRAEFVDAEWTAMPGPPAMPLPARGQAMREVHVSGERTLVGGEDIDVPWAELPRRLEEAAVVRLLAAHEIKDGLDTLWNWERPLQAVEAMLKAQKEQRP